MIYNLALLGYPVEHSLSPQIHNEFFREANFKGGYLCFKTKTEDLQKNINHLQELGFRGINLTIPHKEIILQLPQIKPSEQVKKIGSANTLIFEENKNIIAENTDWVGFLHSLPQKVKDNAKKIIILGAGGSSRSIIEALQTLNISAIHFFIRDSISSWNNSRSLEKLIKSNNSQINCKIHLFEKLPLINDADLIINTTPIGMHGFNTEESPLPESFLDNIKNPHCYFYDLIYNPEETMFLQKAKERGFSIQNGYSMLRLQAAFAFYYWTNFKSKILIT